MLFSRSYAGAPLDGGRCSGLIPQSTCPARVTGLTIEAAHKKGGGSTKNGRDSNAQRRGVKVFGGQPVKAGGIIIRQTGSTVHPGDNVAAGKDYTLYALQEGIVVFKKNKYKKQATVVSFEDYQVPEGQQRKAGGRRDRRKEQYAGARRKKEDKVVAAAAVVVTP